MATVERLLGGRDGGGVTGVNVNGRDEKGKTPLMWASIRGHTQVVRLLLECKDIQIDLVDNDGYQAIHWSVQNGYPDVTQLLLKHGVSVNVQTEPGLPCSGRTPLNLACQCNDNNDFVLLHV